MVDPAAEFEVANIAAVWGEDICLLSMEEAEALPPRVGRGANRCGARGYRHHAATPRGRRVVAENSTIIECIHDAECAILFETLKTRTPNVAMMPERWTPVAQAPSSQQLTMLRPMGVLINSSLTQRSRIIR